MTALDDSIRRHPAGKGIHAGPVAGQQRIDAVTYACPACRGTGTALDDRPVDPSIDPRGVIPEGEPCPSCGGKGTRVMVPQQPGHLGGWEGVKDHAGKHARPFVSLPRQTVNGRCEKGHHDECPQAPRPPQFAAGTCGCPCHQREPETLFDLLDLLGAAA